MALDPTLKRLGRALLGMLSPQAARTVRDLERAARSRPAPSSPPRHDDPHTASRSGRSTRVLDTTRGLPPFTYDPQPDGEADPGEVCWAWVPYEEDPSRGKDRPVLVLARYNRGLIVAQMTSKDHTGTDAARQGRAGRVWMDVGTGAWDRQNRPSEVRLDRLLVVDPADIRREGATLDERRFNAVIARLHELHEG